MRGVEDAMPWIPCLRWRVLKFALFSYSDGVGTLQGCRLAVAIRIRIDDDASVLYLPTFPKSSSRPSRAHYIDFRLERSIAATFGNVAACAFVGVPSGSRPARRLVWR